MNCPGYISSLIAPCSCTTRAALHTSAHLTRSLDTKQIQSLGECLKGWGPAGGPFWLHCQSILDSCTMSRTLQATASQTAAHPKNKMFVKLFLFGIFCFESLREDDETKTLTKIETRASDSTHLHSVAFLPGMVGRRGTLRLQGQSDHDIGHSAVCIWVHQGNPLLQVALAVPVTIKICAVQQEAAPTLSCTASFHL